MSKLLRKYLKEQGSVPPEQDMVRTAAAQSGIDFDKLPPELQTKVSDIVTRWGQNQTTYSQLSDREAQLATQIDAFANQPETPDKQNILNQLNTQLTSTRSELDQVKSSNAEIEAMGKEIEPIVAQLRDTGQAAMTPPAQTPEAPPPQVAPMPVPQAQIAPEPVQPTLGQQALTKAGEVGGNIKDFATKQVTTPPPEGAAPPDMPQAGAGQMEIPQGTPQMTLPPAVQQFGSNVKDWATKQITAPPPEGAAPPDMPPPPQAPPEMHRGTLQNIPQMSVPAHGSPQPAAVAQPAPAPPQPEMAPPPPQPMASEAPPIAPPEAGGMEDVAAGAAAVGIAGAAVMGAYKIYKQFFSKAARACANAPSKDECMQSYRDHGVQAAVNNLKKQIPRCGNDQDCAQKLQMAVQKLESKLGA
jgi:hypothetical protein